MHSQCGHVGINHCMYIQRTLVASGFPTRAWVRAYQHQIDNTLFNIINAWCMRDVCVCVFFTTLAT